MRGDAVETDAVFSYVSPAQRVPQDHPLRIVREITDAALQRLSRDFEGLYSKVGRPSVPPERLLRALLLQYFYGVRSERLLMEQLDYNLLFRWFVGLGMDDRVWDATTFTKNRERLLSGDLAQRFLEEIVAEARSRGLTSDEHFSVDGTMVQAWAGQKSFKKKDGPPGGGSGGGRERDFRGEKRSNETHQSTTDPQARLYRKAHSAESKLSYLGHVVIENRNGLVVGCMATPGNGSRRTRSRRGTHGERAAWTACDSGGGQSLRRAQLHRGDARPGRYSTRHPKRLSWEAQCHRQADDAPRWLRHQPNLAQGDRASLWVAQSGGGNPPSQDERVGPGRLDIHPGHGRVRPRSNEAPLVPRLSDCAATECLP